MSVAVSVERRVIEWLLHGSVGTSSKTVAAHIGSGCPCVAWTPATRLTATEVWEYGDGSHVHACDQCSAPLVLNVTTTVNYELVGSTSEERAVGEWAGIPGYVVVNPKWPDGGAPYMELADDDRLCEDCGGDGFVRHHQMCEDCGGTGLNVTVVAP